MVRKGWIDILVIPRFVWIRTQIGYGNTTLDVGAENGFVWEGTSCNVVKLDKSPKYKPDVLADAEHLPFPGNSFDIVCLCEILEHVADPRVVLKEAVRVARLKVVITVPWEAAWGEKAKPFTNKDHVRYYSPLTFAAELRRIGLPFQIVPIAYGEFEGCKDFPRNVWVGAEIYGCGGVK